ncbi:hypothetical protein QS62_09585 [Gallibacterium salpingitidis]|uniref:Uncharacterized protein n=2 Tax=Gallibacterium salpingitidis TaxID=505341 RepID=A0A1A7NQT9_9PAST|nr:hypothetical protein QS62_09585 [Gallibacterium salpingitidis]
MNLLLLKLILTPTLLLLATLAGRKWGPTAGGLIVGLPLTSGPISYFLLLDHGIEFTQNAITGSLCTLTAQLLLAISYIKFAKYGAVIASIFAILTFILVASLLFYLSLSKSQLLIIGITLIIFSLVSIPLSNQNQIKISSPKWDIPLRLVVITMLVIFVTFIAKFIGPQASGILASFPFMALILGIFTHQISGYQSAQLVMRGLIKGLLGFGIFFYTLSLLLVEHNLYLSYLIATLLAIIVQIPLLIFKKKS